jgi:hypothetical protein
MSKLTRPLEMMRSESDFDQPRYYLKIPVNQRDNAPTMTVELEPELARYIFILQDKLDKFEQMDSVGNSHY